MSAPEADAPPSVTYREVLELLRTFKASGWTGMTLELPGMRITAGRHGPPSAAPADLSAVSGAITPETADKASSVRQPPASEAPGASPPAPAAVDTAGCVPVRSPAVGSFWMAPSPGSPPFVEPGQSVAEGDQLAIVEVMKLMNPVTAPQAGQVVQICAANAELVEYDQVLFLIRPAGA
jgi:acetyl-CoA carboxylase biotin carboxyl carrier protein